MNRDPIGYGGGIDVYTHAWDDPVDNVDASGHSPLSVTCAKAAIACAAAVNTCLKFWERRDPYDAMACAAAAAACALYTAQCERDECKHMGPILHKGPPHFPPR